MLLNVYMLIIQNFTHTYMYLSGDGIENFNKFPWLFQTDFGEATTSYTIVLICHYAFRLSALYSHKVIFLKLNFVEDTHCSKSTSRSLLLSYENSEISENLKVIISSLLCC